jgi:thiol-disulfide isomerase/thioredoxin
MKNLKLAILVFLLSFGAFAQTESKVYAVVTKASWCPVCKQHGNRVITEVLPLYKAPDVSILVYDATDDSTKKTSKVALKTLGIDKKITEHNVTGEISFINAKTKKIISRISVAKSNEEIKKAFDQAIKKSELN